MRNRVQLLTILIILLLFSSCKTTSSIEEIDNVEFLYNKELSNFINEDNHYIFIRLYYPNYTNPFCIENTLKKLINMIDVNSTSFSHSAIGFDLNDNFFGLTTAKPRDLKIEQCTNIQSNLYMYKCNPKTSIQTTYAIKVSKEEYEKAKELVEFLYSEGTEYKVGLNFPIAMFEVKRKFFTSKKNKKLEKLGKNRKDTNFDYSTEFVCSSFVAYVLMNSVDSIKDFFNTNKLNYNYIMPSDLIFFPGVQKLFSSSWQSYTNAALAYVKSENNIFKSNTSGQGTLCSRP